MRSRSTSFEMGGYLQQVRSGGAGVTVLKHALFFGSNPTLYQGREGVAAYFEALPKWDLRAVRFTDVSTAQVNPGTLISAIASFDVDGVPKLSVKITWVAREKATGKSSAITCRRRRR